MNELLKHTNVEQMVETVRRPLSCVECFVGKEENKRMNCSLKDAKKLKLVAENKLKESTSQLEECRDLLNKLTEENEILKQKLRTEQSIETINSSLATTNNSVEQQIHKCDKCDYEAKNINELNGHKKFEHLRCMKCHKPFFSEQHLKSHIDNVHSPAIKPKCLECKIYFPNTIGYDVHMEKKHTKRYKCSIMMGPGKMCAETFRKNQHLKDHKTKSHYDKPKIECTLCGHKTTTGEEMNKHMQSNIHLSVKTKKFKCVQGGQITSNNEMLNAHKNSEPRPCRNGDTCKLLRNNRCQFYHAVSEQSFQQSQSRRQSQVRSDPRPPPQSVRNEQRHHAQSSGVQWCRDGKGL
jgi:hypothetical protein